MANRGKPSVTLFGLLIVTTALSLPAADLKLSYSLDRKSYAPGDSITLSLDVRVPPKYHLYGNPLGPGIGKPLLLTVEGAKDITWTRLLKTPAEKLVQDEEDWVWAYNKEAHFFFRGIIGQEAGGTIEGSIILDGLFCHTSCVPITKKLPFKVTIGTTDPSEPFAAAPRLRDAMATAEPMAFGDSVVEEPPADSLPQLQGIDLGLVAPPAADTGPAQAQAIPAWTYVPHEQGARINILLALFFAFIAGIILNVMPCVLPVLGVKVLSFSKDAGETRRTAVLKSLVFSAGMLSVFMVLASLAAFAQFSWGQQFQNPVMLVGIICIIFVFALGMFDMYVILLPSGVGAAERKSGSGFGGDFMRGMFTTLLATPCSGPFLGATLAWTLTQHPAVIYAVFVALGAGMASPYVLLSASTSVRRIIPKPGEWMNDFKRIMGYLLLGFAVYLMFGLPRDMQIVAVAMCLVLAFALSLYTRLAPFGVAIGRKVVAAVLALAAIAGGIYVCYAVIYATTSEKAVQEAKENAASVKWVPFTPQALLDANARGQDVVVDFTANWCMNCQYNTVAVLHSKRVVELMKRKNVLPLLVDMTGKNPAGESLLRHLGSRSIPFFAVFHGTDPNNPVIMRDVLSVDGVARELEKMTDG